MNKIIVFSACIIIFIIASPVDAMMKQPKTVCSTLEAIAESMNRMEQSINNRLDHIDFRLTQVENAVSWAISKNCKVDEDVNQIRNTLGSFDDWKNSCNVQSNSTSPVLASLPAYIYPEPEVYLTTTLVQDLEIRVGSLEANEINKVQNESLMEDRVTKLENKINVSSNILCETLGSHPIGTLYNKPHLKKEFNKLKSDQIDKLKKKVANPPELTMKEKIAEEVKDVTCVKMLETVEYLLPNGKLSSRFEKGGKYYINHYRADRWVEKGMAVKL